MVSGDDVLLASDDIIALGNVRDRLTRLYSPVKEGKYGLGQCATDIFMKRIQDCQFLSKDLVFDG